MGDLARWTTECLLKAGGSMFLFYCILFLILMRTIGESRGVRCPLVAGVSSIKIKGGSVVWKGGLPQSLQVTCTRPHRGSTKANSQLKTRRRGVQTRSREPQSTGSGAYLFVEIK